MLEFYFVLYSDKSMFESNYKLMEIENTPFKSNVKLLFCRCFIWSFKS